MVPCGAAPICIRPSAPGVMRCVSRWGQIARLGVAAGWSVNRRQLVGSCQASWRRHPSDAGKISCIPPNISGQDRQAAGSGVSTDQKIAERIVFQTITAAVLHKGFACEEQRRLGDVQHAQFHAIEHLVQRFDGRKGQRQLGINDGIDDQPVHLGLGLQLCDGPVGPVRVVFQDSWCRPASGHISRIIAQQRHQVVRAPLDVGLATGSFKPVWLALGRALGLVDHHFAVLVDGKVHPHHGASPLVIGGTTAKKMT